MFNAIIEILEFREIELTGRQYTWVDNLENLTYEKLDRVLTNMEWEQKFPLVMGCALQREISFHTPLLVDSNEAVTTATKIYSALNYHCLKGRTSLL